MWNRYFDNERLLFAFNIWDINSAKSVLEGAAKCSKNIILQTSASVFSNILKKRLREFVTEYQKEIGIKAWLHLDHCKDIEMIRDAIDNGWDSVMIDASSHLLEDNIRITNEVSKYAHERGIPVEAEIGQVRGVEDGIDVRDNAIASKSDILKFLNNTDIDLIAVAFGNAHGEYKTNPNLHYELVEYTTQISDIPFVVHGGSGLSKSEIQRLIRIKGVRKINISTDIKLAYLSGIEKAQEFGYLKKDRFNAIKVENLICKEIGHVVEEKIGWQQF